MFDSGSFDSTSFDPVSWFEEDVVALPQGGFAYNFSREVRKYQPLHELVEPLEFPPDIIEAVQFMHVFLRSRRG